MKLNRISSVLRANRTIKNKGKAALVTSAFLTLLNATAYAEEAVATSTSAETAAPTAAETKAKKLKTNEVEVTNEYGDVEVIEVQGMRGTMTRSLNEKKNNAAIVDAIAAADFGDLPGLSLSDVIENISGASGHRLKGSQNEISIRGLGSYWGYATFNGRTITNSGEGRAVNFKKFPSDLVDKVTIYKSQQANLVEGGTSGTIEIGSVRAVDYGKSKTSVEAQAQYNDYYSDTGNQSPWGGKLTISTIQSFETENFGDMGFSLGYVQSKSANPEENYGSSTTLAACSFKAADGSPLEVTNGDNERCGDRDTDPATGMPDNATMVSPGRSEDLVTLGPNADPDIYGVNGADHLAKFDPNSIFYIPDDSYWRTGDDNDERSSIVGTFQWVPNDQWDINFDYAQSRLEYTEERMELAQERGKQLNSDTLIFDSTGTLLYEEGMGKLTLQGEDRNQVDEFDGYGLNVEFLPSDNLTLAVDASYNKSYRSRVRQRAKFRNDSTTAYSLDSRGTVPKLYLGDSLNIDDANFYYKNVNGELVQNEDYAGPAFDVSSYDSFIGSDGTAYLEYGRESTDTQDEIWAVKFDAEYTIDDNSFFSAVEAGIRYSSEHLTDYADIQTAFNVEDGSRRPIDDNWNSGDNEFDENYPAEHVTLTNAAADCGSNGHSFDGFMAASGGDGDATDFMTFDSKCIIGAYLGGVGFANDPATNDPDIGYYDIGPNPDQQSGQLVDVTEDITAVYAMAWIDTEMAGLPVTGNMGIRYVYTATESTSWAPNAVLTEIMGTDDPTTPDVDESENSYWQTAYTTGPISLEDDYSEWLPSVNLTFHLSDEWLLRTAAYRSMSRFSLNAMSAGQVISDCGSSSEGDEDSSCSSYDDQLQNGVAQGNMMAPYTANNFDLSLEWYPSLDVAVTLAGYLKKFTGGTELVTENRVPEVTSVYLDGTTTVGPYSHSIPFSANQVKEEVSTINGFELTYQQHFTELPGVLSGLGFKAAWNHAVSDFDSVEPANWGISPDANVMGFSKNVGSGSIYWEGDDLSMRLMYKYRSRYFQPNNLPFPHKANRWVEDSDYLDAAIKYKFNKHFEVSLKALNLLEEAQVMTRGTGTVSDYSYSGRKFFLGMKAKF
ncbi:TonB-dependent receptor [Colwellia echini]|uniref:TonB-dependent receptor n=1 Tax=Colwellia echini TaxID=1982103 RepID=A0ABY3MVB6_9GAMM|nr:TonB-dependent receptor [Colwellia echini]TYK65134.1 TonB-dependent receptor [Colwellia echini]